MLILLSGPICLLCFYLAGLCYRRAYYRHTLVLGIFAVLLLIITFGLIGASVYTWDQFQIEAAGL